jgi:hypothetical protein
LAVSVIPSEARGAGKPKGFDVKRIALLAVVAGAAMLPSTASASYGLSAGGIAACASSLELNAGELAPVPQLSAYPGPPGPFAGPNSRIDYADGKNNGTDLVLFCQSQLD